jgi:galactokinase
VFTSNIPIGAGYHPPQCSSGRVVSGFAWEPPGTHRSVCENDWVGVKSGIMDQMIVAVGKRGSAVRIDCRSLEYHPVPLPEAASLVIVDTGTRRGLVDSAYNERREQCEQAARSFGLRSLRDLDLDRLQTGGQALAPEILRRARHVVTENERVEMAVLCRTTTQMGWGPF